MREIYGTAMGAPFLCKAVHLRYGGVKLCRAEPPREKGQRGQRQKDQQIARDSDVAGHHGGMMEVTRLRVLYGVLGEGAERVARDPSGYLAIEQGIYRQHGLELSWDHIQGTDERNQALTGGEADLSLVIGRASLQHFLRSGATRVIGSCMNSSPYLLMAPAEVREAFGPPGQGLGMPPRHRRDGAAGRDVSGPRVPWSWARICGSNRWTPISTRWTA